MVGQKGSFALPLRIFTTYDPLGATQSVLTTFILETTPFASTIRSYEHVLLIGTQILSHRGDKISIALHVDK